MRSSRAQRRLVALAVVGAGYAVQAGEAFAADRTWLNGSGGTFTVASNWSGGQVPGAIDNAVFNLNDSGYTVQFATNVITNNLHVLEDIVTLDLNGFSYALNNSANVSGPDNAAANLKLLDGTFTTTGHFFVNGSFPNGAATLALQDVALRTNGMSLGFSRTGAATVEFTAGGAVDWVNAGTVTVGSSGGAGNLVAGQFGTFTTDVLLVARGEATGLVRLDRDAQLNAGTFHIADGGVGTLEVLGGGQVNATGILRVGDFTAGAPPTAPSHGTALIDGADSRITAASLVVGGGSDHGTLTIRNGAVMSTTGAASIGLFAGAGTVMLQDPGSRWNAASITVGSSGFGRLDVNPGTSVIASGTFNIGTFGVANLDNATLSVGTFTRSGLFNFNSGTLIVTGASGLLVAGGSGPLPSQFILDEDKTLRVTGTLTIGGGGIVSMRGGQLLGGNIRITSNGQLLLEDAASVISSAPIQNDGGRVLGSGTVFANYSGTNNAELRVSQGERIRFSGAATNAAQINLFGGELEILNGLTNQASGRINGRGVLRTGSLSNSGTVALSAGLSDVFGAFTNNATGKTIVTGSAVATFYDGVTNDAGSEFRVSTNSTAVFFGSVSGLSAFSGTGTVVFEGPASLGAIDRGGATVVESAGSLEAASVRDRVLTVRGPVTILPNGSPNATSRVSELQIDGGRLELNDNDLVIDYDGASPIQTVRQQLQSGYANGAWTGDGIATSMGNASNLGLGYAEASAIFATFPATFSGQGVDNTSVLVAFTRFGDANLDGLVNLTDFNRLASNFGGTDRVWSQGDFNYDGLVNLTDFNRLASNFGLSATGSTVTPADWAALASAVPEPWGAALASVVPAWLGRGRRRRG